LADEQRIAPSYFDGWKRLLLGKPMITDDLQHEKLSNGVALGALSPDAISSTAYGPEQIMVELLPAAGMAAFVLLLPLVGVILLILALVTASYRQVVTVYTRAGGSYIVARENFGPRVAQIAAAALLIDYVVTVAIQCAAGTVAVASAIPVLGPYSLDKIARVISRIPGASAQIVAYDISSRVAHARAARRGHDKQPDRASESIEKVEATTLAI
jgi:amino acid transporter